MCNDEQNTISFYEIYKIHYMIALQNISYDIGELTQVENECLNCIKEFKEKISEFELKKLEKLCLSMSKVAKLLVEMREIMNDDDIIIDFDK